MTIHVQYDHLTDHWRVWRRSISGSILFVGSMPIYDVDQYLHKHGIKELTMLKNEGEVMTFQGMIFQVTDLKKSSYANA